MKTSKILLLLIFLFFINGCSLNSQVSTSLQTSNSSFDSKKEINECKKKGGEWKEVCNWGCYFMCYIKYKDKDKPCGDSSECKDGLCLLDDKYRQKPPSPDEIKKIINQKEGKCQGDNSPISCWTFINRGEVQSYCQ